MKLPAREVVERLTLVAGVPVDEPLHVDRRAGRRQDGRRHAGLRPGAVDLGVDRLQVRILDRRSRRVGERPGVVAVGLDLLPVLPDDEAVDLDERRLLPEEARRVQKMPLRAAEVGLKGATRLRGATAGSERRAEGYRKRRQHRGARRMWAPRAEGWCGEEAS